MKLILILYRVKKGRPGGRAGRRAGARNRKKNTPQFIINNRRSSIKPESATDPNPIVLDMFSNTDHILQI